MPEQKQERKSWLSTFPGRPVVCALLLFVLINVALSAVKPNLQVKPTDLPVRLSWEWWRDEILPGRTQGTRCGDNGFITDDDS